MNLFVLRSAIRKFGFAEDTHVRKNSNIFGFSLTKSYFAIIDGEDTPSRQ